MMPAIIAIGQMTYDNDLSFGWYWTAATGNVNHYNVYLRINSGSWNQVGAIASAPTQDNPYQVTFTVADNIAFKLFYLQVEAEDASGITGPKSEESLPVMATPGDANYDGWVELTDFTLVSRYWQLSPQSPSWNTTAALADINDDNIVNVTDMSLITLYWGNVYYNGAPSSPNIAVDNSLGQLRVVGEVVDYQTVVLIIGVEKAQQVSSIGFKLDLGPAMNLEQLSQSAVLDKDNFWWPNQDQNSAMIINLEQPVDGNTELLIIRARLNQDYLDWYDQAIVKLTSGQLANGERSSFCSAIAFISLKPKENLLAQNYPNPFNPETWIPYQLAENSEEVMIEIRNLNGQIIRTLNLGYQSAGFYCSKNRAAYWDGCNETGEDTASGVYFYTIKAATFSQTKKMVILR